MSGKGKGKSNGKGKGLKPCPRGRDCPFINEHQHIWEYSHDNPGESKEAKSTASMFPGAGNKVGGFIGKAHKLGGTGPGGGNKLGGSVSGSKLLSTSSVVKLGAPPSNPAPRIPSQKTLSPHKSTLPVKRPGDVAFKKAVVVDLTLDESPPAPKKFRA